MTGPNPVDSLEKIFVKALFSGDAARAESLLLGLQTDVLKRLPGMYAHFLGAGALASTCRQAAGESSRTRAHWIGFDPELDSVRARFGAIVLAMLDREIGTFFRELAVSGQRQRAREVLLAYEPRLVPILIHRFQQRCGGAPAVVQCYRETIDDVVVTAPSKALSFDPCRGLLPAWFAVTVANGLLSIARKRQREDKVVQVMRLAAARAVTPSPELLARRSEFIESVLAIVRTFKSKSMQEIIRY
jgi:hypothetical protein